MAKVSIVLIYLPARTSSLTIVNSLFTFTSAPYELSTRITSKGVQCPMWAVLTVILHPTWRRVAQVQLSSMAVTPNMSALKQCLIVVLKSAPDVGGICSIDLPLVKSSIRNSSTLIQGLILSYNNTTNLSRIFAVSSLTLSGPELRLTQS